MQTVVEHDKLQSAIGIAREVVTLIGWPALVFLAIRFTRWYSKAEAAVFKFADQIVNNHLHHIQMATERTAEHQQKMTEAIVKLDANLTAMREAEIARTQGQILQKLDNIDK